MSGPEVIPSLSEDSSRARRGAWIAGVLTFVIVFGVVCCMGADRLQSNPLDVLGTSALFAGLASVLGARIGWRLARKK